MSDWLYTKRPVQVGDAKGIIRKKSITAVIENGAGCDIHTDGDAFFCLTPFDEIAEIMENSTKRGRPPKK